MFRFYSGCAKKSALSRTLLHTNTYTHKCVSMMCSSVIKAGRTLKMTERTIENICMYGERSGNGQLQHKSYSAQNVVASIPLIVCCGGSQYKIVSRESKMWSILKLDSRTHCVQHSSQSTRAVVFYVIYVYPTKEALLFDRTDLFNSLLSRKDLLFSIAYYK